MAERASAGAEGPPAGRAPVDRRLLRMSPAARVGMGLSVGVGLVVALGTLLQAIALGDLLGEVFATRGARLAHEDVVLFLLGLSLSALGALLGPPVTQRAASAATAPLRRRALEAAAAERTTRQRAALVSLLTRGVDATTTYLATYLPALILAVVAPVLLLTWIVWADPMSALIVGATVVVLPVFMILLGKEAATKMRTSWTETQRLSGHFGDVLRGMRTLRSFNRSRRQVEILESISDELRTSTMATLRVAMLSSFALELLSSVATALVALALGLRLIGGHVTLSTALAVLIVTPEIYLPLRRASAQYHAATDGVGAAADLLDLSTRTPAGAASPQGDAIVDQLVAGGSPSIVFEEVEIERAGAVLYGAPISATLGAGEHVELLGPSGSGKSSLLGLLLGLEAPARGRVLIEGVDLLELDLVRWRTLLGWLPQRATFPGATVRTALAMREPGVDDAVLRALVDAVGLSGLLKRSDLLDRPAVGVLKELSTGERHRLGVIRALLGQPRVLLLDELFAHLDDQSAASVASLVESRWSGVTTLLATHEHVELLVTDELLLVGSVEVRDGR